MTGLNDARFNGTDVKALAAYADALTVIFEAFQAANPDGRIVAVEQPHLRDYSWHAPYDNGSDVAVDAYNERLREAVARYSSVVLARGDCWLPRP